MNLAKYHAILRKKYVAYCRSHEDEPEVIIIVRPKRVGKIKQNPMEQISLSSNMRYRKVDKPMEVKASSVPVVNKEESPINLEYYFGPTEAELAKAINADDICPETQQKKNKKKKKKKRKGKGVSLTEVKMATIDSSVPMIATRSKNQHTLSIVKAGEEYVNGDCKTSPQLPASKAEKEVSEKKRFFESMDYVLRVLDNFDSDKIVFPKPQMEKSTLNNGKPILQDSKERLILENDKYVMINKDHLITTLKHNKKVANAKILHYLWSPFNGDMAHDLMRYLLNLIKSQAGVETLAEEDFSDQDNYTDSDCDF
jgi:hypothetical protein